MEQQKLSPQKLGIQLLQTVQALYQSGEITKVKKDKMLQEIKDAIKNSDFSEYRNSLYSVRFCSSFKKYIDEDLSLIDSIKI